MAYFALVDENNVVQNVISISNSVIQEPSFQFPDTEHFGQLFIQDTLGLSGKWLQTSFNSNFRGTYAGIGYSYDPVNDVFVPPPDPEPTA